MGLRLAIIAMALAGASGVRAQESPVSRHGDDVPPSQAPSIQSAKPEAAAPPARSSSAKGDPTTAQIDAWLKADAQPVQTLAPDADDNAPTLDRRIHGEVGATVSNRGYSGFAAASVPIGQASELDVALAGGHVRTRFGNANPKSIAIGLYLDGGDVARWLSRDKCNVPRWGVSLKDDPQVLPDGSCLKVPATRRDAPLSTTSKP